MNRGGAEAMLMNYYRNIDRSRVQFDFLLTEQNRCQFEEEIELLGGRVYRVPLLRWSNPLPYINGVKRFLGEHPEYRIVHSHTSSKSVVPLWIAKKCGVPVRIAHSHNNKSESGVSGRVRDLLKIPLKYVATDFFACGEEAAKWLYGQRMWNAGEVIILANAIPVDVFRYDRKQREDIRSELGIQLNSFVFGMVARFSVQKNHMFAVDLIKTLKTNGNDVTLLLVGDGELKNHILQSVEDLGIGDRVVMTGVVSDVQHYLQAMDVVLMPSFNEGLPVSLIEAQVNGLSVVASTGVPHEVDITGNVTFLPLDISKWADCLTSMISKGIERDAKAADTVQAAGYDIKTASKWLEDWYVSKSRMAL
jgi:glycosyltransferase involved in cell wall biosynthesis